MFAKPVGSTFYLQAACALRKEESNQWHCLEEAFDVTKARTSEVGHDGLYL
jgi:hypothetical protein